MQLTPGQYCANLREVYGIACDMVFVPQSQSRNKDEKRASLNWLVTIRRGRVAKTFEYSQGIGHAPKLGKGPHGFTPRYPALVTVHDAEIERSWAEKGTYKGKKLTPPTMEDVLYCLTTEADVINYQGFEDWAQCMGYDEDSRSAEAIYKACLDTARFLNSIIDLDEAREAFKDF